MTDKNSIPYGIPTSDIPPAAGTQDSLVMLPSSGALQGPGRLSVRLTLHGDAFVLRYQAKGGGYTWTGKEWQREISTPILGEGKPEMTLARGELLDLVRTEAAMFTCASSFDAPVLIAWDVTTNTEIDWNDVRVRRNKLAL